jgi:hypothetical protein
VGKERITKILTAEDRIQLQLLTKGEKKKESLIFYLNNENVGKST